MANKNYDKSDLIPDYCNNRLNAEDKAEFEKLLGEDQELMAELKDFQEFQQLYRQIDPVEPAPSDAVFEQITRNIKEVREVKKTSPSKSSQLTESFINFWDRLRESMTVPWMLAAVQTMVIVLLLMPVTQENTYTTLSGSDGPVLVEQFGINVVFQPNALESEIRNLMHEIDGSVTGGPSREGRYVISLGNVNDRDKAVQTLRDSEFVLFAEPIL